MIGSDTQLHDYNYDLGLPGDRARSYIQCPTAYNSGWGNSKAVLDVTRIGSGGLFEEEAGEDFLRRLVKIFSVFG